MKGADWPAMLGTLSWTPALDRPDLLAEPVAAALRTLGKDAEVGGGGTGGSGAGGGGADDVLVAEIDPTLADTAAFCDAYGVGLDVSANCVVVAAKRGGERQLAACVVLATTRADVNGLVRRHLDARKASFAPMDLAVSETGMEYGGITPIGLPPAWPVLVDAAAAAAERAIVGSGLRRSKLAVPGPLLARLPGAEVLDGLGRPPD